MRWHHISFSILTQSLWCSSKKYTFQNLIFGSHYFFFVCILIIWTHIQSIQHNTQSFVVCTNNGNYYPDTCMNRTNHISLTCLLEESVEKDVEWWKSDRQIFLSVLGSHIKYSYSGRQSWWELLGMHCSTFNTFYSELHRIRSAICNFRHETNGTRCGTDKQDILPSSKHQESFRIIGYPTEKELQIVSWLSMRMK